MSKTIMGATGVRPGWQERAEKLCDESAVGVLISLQSNVWEGLSPDERTRLTEKLKIVQRLTQLLTVGMIKGTIKYSGDVYDAKQFSEMLLGEGADLLNYIGMMAEHGRDG